MTERLGADPANWRYGQEAMKHVHITHTMAQAVDDETRALLEVGPWPRGRLRVHGEQHRRRPEPDLRAGVSG